MPILTYLYLLLVFAPALAIRYGSCLFFLQYLIVISTLKLYFVFFFQEMTFGSEEIVIKISLLQHGTMLRWEQFQARDTLTTIQCLVPSVSIGFSLLISQVRKT